jgi:hypothetical protein
MKTLLTSVAVLLAVVGFALSAYLYRAAIQLDHLVAVSWGDGKYGRALYGAYVFYEERDSQVLVKLSVRIDRGSFWSQYAHDTRTLGTAKDAADAVAQWGTITWSAEGLKVGSPPGPTHLFPRAELESHR